MLTWFAILDSSSNSLEVARRQMPKAASRAPPLRAAGLVEEDPEPARAVGRHRVNQGSSNGMSTQGHSRTCCFTTNNSSTAKGWARLWTAARSTLCLGIHAGCKREAWPHCAARCTAAARGSNIVHCNLRGPSDMNLLPYGGCVCAVWAEHDAIASSTFCDRSPNTGRGTHL